MKNSVSLDRKNESFLKERGIPITYPRLELLKLLQNSNQGLTAHDIFVNQFQAGLKIPLSTIYANLKKLEDAKIVKKIESESLHHDNKSIYYLSNKEDHIKFKCIQCGASFFSTDKIISDLIKKSCKSRNFKDKKYSISIKGLCQNCQSQ